MDVTPTHPKDNALVIWNSVACTSFLPGHDGISGM